MKLYGEKITQESIRLKVSTSPAGGGNRFLPKKRSSRHIKNAKPTVEDKSYICGSIKELKVRTRRFQYSSFGFMPGTANSANHVLAEEGRRYVSFVYGIEEEPVRVDEEAGQD
ncbi:hypothetical protein Gotri_013243 [Gossypium trilobum]|uniref:Uncharacterized protein n=1 Tax=Gossypium trilobum TaxID=34281 RepID=A0A7J9DSX8_9ROSI|nr:hypothetical protein [Gossypium trilobum]